MRIWDEGALAQDNEGRSTLTHRRHAWGCRCETRDQRDSAMRAVNRHHV